MPNKRKNFSEPSREFMRAVIHSGTNVINCTLCGRVHFAGIKNGYDWVKGEYEDLVKQAEKNPNKFIAHYDTDSISWGSFAGKQIVDGCPCNLARKYEEIIWEGRFVIADYLKNKVEELQRKTEDETGLVQRVSDSLQVLE